MTDHDRLFDAVLSAPDDDTPRLVYADFLEEMGGPVNAARAKLIRLTCERDRLAWYEPDYKRLNTRCEQYEARIRSWQDETGTLFTPGRRVNLPRLSFSRGLPVADVTVYHKSALPDLPTGCSAAVRFDVSGMNEQSFFEWFADRAVGWVLARRVIAVTAGRYSLPLVYYLDRLPPLFPRLTRLALLSPAVADWTVDGVVAHRLPLLRELALSINQTMSTIALRTMVRGPLCASLQTLTLSGGYNPASQFPDLEERLNAWPEPDRPFGWVGYNVPLPNRQPLRLVFDDSIPF